MKVAIVSTSFPSSPEDPAGHFVEAEALELAEEGHDVTVICPQGVGPPRSHRGPLTLIELPDAGAFGWPGAVARLRERPLRTLGATRFVLEARRVLADLSGIDRIVAHWLVPAGWPIAIAGSAPIEVVVHGTDARLLCRAPAAFREHVLASLIRRKATFRFVSRELLHVLDAHTTFDLARHSRVEPCALSLDGAPTHDQARFELGLEAHERVLVIAARLVGDKRVDVALSAATLVPDARVIVLGDGPEHERLAEAFPGAELLGRLPRSAALTWLAAADVVLSASRLEGAPSVIREARALGTPVVATPAGDLSGWAETDPDLWLVR
ncbi:MAG: glycosyltransferase family 4 protein [Myxococcales bacterium]|nr:glycosyltransferase family 4 protein [Myxococcales bacterium]MCB9577952.1 glycosyltransferase family 4 protein [Polyangiaceae bacterium]